MKKDVLVLTDSKSILLALFNLEQERYDTIEDNNPPQIPLGQLYNQVSKDNDNNWIELHTFNTSIENMAEAGLTTINTPTTTPTSTIAKTQEPSTTTTQLRTVSLTPAGRDLARQHPEWLGTEAPERALAAAGGSRR